MTIAVVATKSFSGGPSAAIDTTGANFLVYFHCGTQATSAPTDSKSNTWTDLDHVYENVDALGVRLWVCASPSVGSGHTFTAPAFYESAMVFALSGVNATYDDTRTSASNSGSVTSIQPGSLTPSQDGDILLGALANNVNGTSSSHTLSGLTSIGAIEAGSAINADGGYVIQTTATALNPTFGWTTGSTACCMLFAIKAAAGGGGGSPALMGQACL